MAPVLGEGPGGVTFSAKGIGGEQKHETEDLGRRQQIWLECGLWKGEWHPLTPS